MITRCLVVHIGILINNYSNLLKPITYFMTMETLIIF